MKRISIVSPLSLKSVHGANYVLDFFVKSKSFMKEVCINKIYSADETLYVIDGEEMPIGKGIGTSSYKRKRQYRSLLREMMNSKYYLWARLKEYLNFIKPAIKTARKAIKDEDSDWIIFQESYGAYYYLKMRRNTKVRTAMIIHQADDSLGQLLLLFPAFSKGKRLDRLMRRREYVFKNLDRIIYISKKAYNNSIYTQKRYMIYNGIPDIPESQLSKYRQDGIVNMACVGSMAGRKGQDVIIKALSYLPKEVLEKVNLYLIGGGEEQENLKKLSKELKVENNVKFMGVRSDVADILSDMDVFILPSLNEGLSISSLEALRAGLYLLMTDTGGNCEVMGDDCGMVITRDPLDVSSKITMIVKDGIISESQKAKSVDRFCQLFSLEKMAEGYEKMVMSY